nr:MAG TPA: hypothetical protein [Caudoviricetes sp.]
MIISCIVTHILIRLSFRYFAYLRWHICPTETFLYFT